MVLELFVVALLIFFTSIAVHHLLKSRRHNKVLFQSDSRNRRILLVIAHPDDECMFFAPTILNLRHCGQYELFLLCFSSGNYNQQGRVRQRELIESCRHLGIRENNVFIIDRRDIADDPSTEWDKQLIAEILAECVKDYYIDLIFTFDEYGVSGHINHKSLFHGCRHFVSSVRCPAGFAGYQLVSVNLLRKYSSILELPLTYFTSDIIFISGWSDFLKAQAAMSRHGSQFVWFRVLYVVFSRYMVVNSYKPILKEKTNGHS